MTIGCYAYVYRSGAWASYLPIFSPYPFDKSGQRHKVGDILTPQHGLNVTVYDAYSPIYLSSVYLVAYLLSFTLSTAVLVHTALYHGRAFINSVKRIKIEEDGIHAKLMRNYPEVPDWWYLSIPVVFFCFAIVVVWVRLLSFSGLFSLCVVILTRTLF